MARLVLHNQDVESVFQLLGDKENDISFSVAWVLSRCNQFLKRFIESQIGSRIDPKEIEIDLQHNEKEQGTTDVEIKSSTFHIIIEAKRGWNLPSRRQLEKYAKRGDFV